jgi:hypothetical protein
MAFELVNRNTAVQRSIQQELQQFQSHSTIDPMATRDLVAYSFTITLGPTITGFE